MTLGHKILLLHLLYSLTIYGQTKINLSDSFNITKDFSTEFKDIERQLGKPTEINKDPIDAPFCSRTLGQDVHFIYENYEINISTRKYLSGFKKRKIGKGKKYYKNCSLNQTVISGTSSLKINDSIFINKINSANIEKLLGKPVSIKTFSFDRLRTEICSLPTNTKSLIEKNKKEFIRYAYIDSLSNSCFGFYFLSTGELFFIQINSEDYGG